MTHRKNELYYYGMNTKFLQIIWILSRLRYQLETVQTFSKLGSGDRGNSLHSLGFLNNQQSPRVHVALGLSDFGTVLRGPCPAKPVRNASRPGGKNDQVARGPAVLWIPLGKGLQLWTDGVFSFSRSQYATDYREVTHNTSAGNMTIEKVRVFVRSLTTNPITQIMLLNSRSIHDAYLFLSRTEDWDLNCTV